GRVPALCPAGPGEHQHRLHALVAVPPMRDVATRYRARKHPSHLDHPPARLLRPQLDLAFAHLLGSYPSRLLLFECLRTACESPHRLALDHSRHLRRLAVLGPPRPAVVALDPAALAWLGGLGALSNAPATRP